VTTHLHLVPNLKCVKLYLHFPRYLPDVVSKHRCNFFILLCNVVSVGPTVGPPCGNRLLSGVHEHQAQLCVQNSKEII
jgi:hypothetical protein